MKHHDQMWEETVYLHSWEDGEVNLLVNVIHDLSSLLGDLAQPLAVKDHGSPRASQRLVSGCGHHI